MAFQLTHSIQISQKELTLSYSRSRGPGGQKVNKTNTRVTLRWSPAVSLGLTTWQKTRIANQLSRRINEDGELVIHSDRFRDRGRNVVDVLQKLSELVSEALKVRKKRIKTKPKKAAKEKRLKEKKQRSDIKKNRRSVNY